jgi:two-component system sensor histidine kinase UhpB
MPAELKLLLLEDAPADAGLIQELLQRSGMQFTAVVASNKQEFLSAIAGNSFDVVLADNALPQYNSLEALKIIKQSSPGIAFILVTGTVSEEFAVNILQQGADDYILKNNLTRLPAAINKTIERKRIEQEKKMEKELSDSIINSLPGIFYFYDAKGNFLRWNKNFEIVLEYGPVEIKTMKAKDFFEEKDSESVGHWIEKTFKEGYATTETTILSKSGKRTPYYFTGSSIYFNDQACLIGIGLDISASKKSEEELRQLNEELRKVSVHLEKIREEERTRIAREVHDQLGQQLTALKMDLSWIEKKINTQAKTGEIQQKFDEMFQMMDEAVTTIRKVAADLRPSVLDDFGLIEALNWQSSEFTKRSEIPVHFSSPDVELKFEPGTAVGLLRIYQEALTNIARHAAAKKVLASLEILPDHIILVIKDDGKGFDSARQKKSLGLMGMKERAVMIGGEVQIISEPGIGTTIIISAPLISEKKSGN